MGYSTILASDALQIAPLFDLHQRRMAMIIIDISLLKAAGRAFIDHLRTFWPSVPVLLTTFLDEIEVPEHFRKRFPVLQTPFTAPSLPRTNTRSGAGFASLSIVLAATSAQIRRILIKRALQPH